MKWLIKSGQSEWNQVIVMGNDGKWAYLDEHRDRPSSTAGTGPEQPNHRPPSARVGSIGWRTWHWTRCWPKCPAGRPASATSTDSCASDDTPSTDPERSSWNGRPILCICRRICPVRRWVSPAVWPWRPIGPCNGCSTWGICSRLRAGSNASIDGGAVPDWPPLRGWAAPIRTLPGNPSTWWDRARKKCPAEMTIRNQMVIMEF